jgi:putative peptide zinc metalloprotease protein
MSVAFVIAIATALRWNEISTSLPPLETLIRGDRIVLMALTLAVIKSLHELGHAMACHRYTRESGEIGLLFLVFTPCLYCDVSSSWKLRSRWQRANIALAGIYIEVLLATLAILLLAFVSSDVVRSIAFNVFIVCSLGTFLVNGNPLLKYDGYFALSDLLGIPNLAEQAREAALSFASKWFTKAPTLPTPLDGSPYFLIAYWLCSSIYRFVLTVMVLWGINWLLRPLGLEIVAYYIVLLAIAGIAWRCLKVIPRIPSSLSESGGLRWGPALLVLAAMMCSSMLIFIVPISDGVTARGVVRFRDMQPVYLPQSGRLVASIEREGRLQKGEVVYQLESTDHEIRELEAFNEVQLLTQKIAMRKELTALNPKNDLQLPALERILESKQRQLATIQAEGESLVLRAASDSYWFHALPSFQPAIENLNLLTWTGFPLAGENLGTNLEKGTLLGWLVQQKESIIEAFVSEKDVERIRIGAVTNVRVEYGLERSYRGEVLSIGTEPIAYLPEELAADWFIIAQQDSQNRWVPEAPLFRVQVLVADAPPDIVLGGRANVRIETRSATLADKALRLLKQTIFYQRQKEF